MKFSFPFLKEAVCNLFSKPSTVNFPKVAVEAAPKYRGRIAYDAEKCVNCGMCIKVCSPGAITRTSEDVPEGEKITYEFDLTSCTFCGMCQDFCTTNAENSTERDYFLTEAWKIDQGRLKKDYEQTVNSLDAIGFKEYYK
ncbi:MAG: 4Fe-4S dicluster domain-containing protein, partial [Oscillospiraceae bacterium]|nr:4Fe-4S dicluster domain-containing protein [Oscillospiraceae bacterium]